MMREGRKQPGQRQVGDRQAAVALNAKTWPGEVPQVTAVGFGKNAKKILELAFANDVKVRQDKDLTAILAAMEVGSPVPLEALAAVSEILAYLYRAGGAPAASATVAENGDEPTTSAEGDLYGQP
jgi:flagellar biosynthesis protein